MRKFVFTLQAFYNYKETLKRKQRSDLEQAQARLRKLREEEASLQQAFARYGPSLINTLEQGQNTVYMLEKHSDYFKHLQETKEVLDLKIIKAVEEENNRRELLSKTMRELKTLENLRDEQYLNYLEEVRAEEAKELNDLISARTIAQQQVLPGI